MRNSALPSAKMDCSIGIPQLRKYADGWFLACEIRPCSPATLASRRIYIRNLFWFLERQEYTSCGITELRAFFSYFNTGHKESGGRWGNPQEKTPVKPATILTYHRSIRAMFNWIVTEGGMDASPMARIPPPIDRPDDIQPFTDEQITALVAAAKKSRQARRDEAIVWFLLDTGARASELCSLRFSDLDMTLRRANIAEGKGGKGRVVPFGKVAAKALWQYLKEDGRQEDDPAFLSERGDALTRSGLLAIIRRLGQAAGISSARCSPHTFRHSMAVCFLRNGGNQLTAMQLLGHTDLKMTARYVKLAQADVEKQHRQYSPADGLKGGRKR